MYALLGLLLLGSGASWFVLSSWVPTKGKALLMQEVQRRTPLEASIGTMRYHLLRGILLEQVQLTERATREQWALIPQMQIRVSWLTLLLQKRLVFGGRASLQAPCETAVAFSGRIPLRDLSLRVELDTADVPLRSLTAPLTRHVPAALTDGTLRLHLRAERPSGGALTLTGRLEGHEVVWQEGPLQLRGEVVLSGTAAAPAEPGGRWEAQAEGRIRRATIEGLARTGTVSNVEGLLHLTPQEITIDQMSGDALGSSWTLEGAVSLQPAPFFEGLLSSRVELEPLVAAFPDWLRDERHEWQPSGAADLRVVCRALLNPLMPDCLAEAQWRDITLKGRSLPDPLTDLTGRLLYDHVMRRVSIEPLEATLRKQPLAVRGEVAFAPQPRMALEVNGTLPLEAALPWLPASHPFSELEGTADVALTIDGPMRSPQYLGRIELRDSRARFKANPTRVEQLAALILLDRDRLDIQEGSLRVNDQPVTVAATLTPMRRPRIITTIGFPQGELWLNGRLTDQELLIDEGRLSLTQSRLQLSGQVGRDARRTSALRLNGSIELADLNRLPFLPLPQIQAWGLQGVTIVDLRVTGPLSDLPRTRIAGRLDAERLRIKELLIEQLSCQIDQIPEGLQLRVPFALIADGKFRGEFTLERRPRVGDVFLVEGDLTGLQLAKLSQLIPAWRTRDVSGSASSRASFGGAWNRRDSWRGEGWLNATGERMGNLPLLNKVFRGLFGALADRLGLESLRRFEITQASVHWRLAQERLQTDDLRLGGLAGAEPVGVYAKGSVGLDGTLDLVVEPELSEGLVLQSPMTSTMATAVLKAAGGLERMRRLVGRHRLTGTLKEPSYRFELSTQEIFKQLVPTTGDLIQNLLDAVR